MSQDDGLWSLVVLNSALLLAFGESSFHPRTGRDWRAMSGNAAFIVALMTEMSGAALTVRPAGVEEREGAALPQQGTVSAARVHPNVPHRPDESGPDGSRGPEAGSHAHR